MRVLYFCISGFAWNAVALNDTDEINVSTLSNASNNSVDFFDNASYFVALPRIIGTLSDAEEFANASNLTLAQDILNSTSLYLAANENSNEVTSSDISTTVTTRSTVISTTTVTTSTSSAFINSSLSTTSSMAMMVASTTMLANSTSEAPSTSDNNIGGAGGNVTSANTSSSSLNLAEDATTSSRGNSSQNELSQKTTFENNSNGTLRKGPDDAKEARESNFIVDLKWAIVITLSATLLIGITTWLVSRRHCSPPQGAYAQSKSDIESGLDSITVLPVMEPASCEEPMDKVTGFNEDTDSVAIVDDCCPSGVVLQLMQSQGEANECSSQPDEAFSKLEVACDEGARSCTTSNSGILDTISPLHADDENPDLAVPLERMGSTPVTSGTDLKVPLGGSDQIHGLMGFFALSFPRRWFPTSCRKPMTEGIRDLSHLSRTPSLSSTCST